MMSPVALQVGVTESTGPHVLDELGHHLDMLVEHHDVALTSRRPWLSAWISAYPSYQPWAISAWESNQLVGTCLLARRRVDYGAEVIALGQGRNDRTCLLAFDQEIADRLATTIAVALRHCQRPWALRIEQLPPADPLTTALLQQLPGASVIPGGSVPGVDFARHQPPQEHLSKNLRRQLQKSRNRLATDGIHADIAFTRVCSLLYQQLDEIEEIHRTRDHDVGRISDIDDPAARRLWRNLITTHIQQHQVEIATLRLDDALAAYVISFLDRTTYRVFDGRFETHWARYSPGRLLEAETLTHAISDQQFQRLDWMNSIAPDKLISANTIEPTMHLVATSTSGGRELTGRPRRSR